MAPAAATFECVASPFGRALEVTRQATRAAIVATLLVALVYCGITAWRVLQELGSVRLVDAWRSLEVVSVRDAILCGVGYHLGRDVLRVITRPRRG